eukprot:7042578-Alexandrium_andersonii.AAC.1
MQGVARGGGHPACAAVRSAGTPVDADCRQDPGGVALGPRSGAAPARLLQGPQSRGSRRPAPPSCGVRDSARRAKAI